MICVRVDIIYSSGVFLRNLLVSIQLIKHIRHLKLLLRLSLPLKQRLRPPQLPLILCQYLPMPLRRIPRRNRRHPRLSDQGTLRVDDGAEVGEGSVQVGQDVGVEDAGAAEGDEVGVDVGFEEFGLLVEVVPGTGGRAGLHWGGEGDWRCH